MKVLSLFDGISCARVALKKAGIPVEVYYASEIDKYAIQISKKNWPDIVQVGSVVGLDTKQFKNIGLLIGGSPCQDLSIAKKDRKGLDGDRSSLFWEYVRILREVKPKWFILENVASMPKEAKEIITKELGVEPIMIDAALVSAQRRKRLFWTNIPNVKLPEDRGILLKDILEDIPKNDIPLKEKSKTIRAGGRSSGDGDRHEWDSVYQYRRTYWRETKGGKVPTLTANMGTGGNNVPYVCRATVQKNAEQYSDKAPTLTQAMGVGGGNVPLVMSPEKAENHKGKYIDGKERYDGIRKLTPLECERLQSLSEIEKSCIIEICLDNQNNHVVAENQNLKSQNVALNVGKDGSRENVFAGTSLSTSNQPKNRPALVDVSIVLSEKSIEIYSQSKLLANVSYAELKEKLPHLKQVDDFAQVGVGICSIAEQIVASGEEELLQKSNCSAVARSGVNVVSLYGKGILQLAGDAEKNTTILKKLSMSTTSDRFGQENKERIIQILFLCVASAIIGYIPKEMKNQNTLTCEIKSKVGYTFGVSNTQRYKALGNAFNVDVVAHILSFIPKK